MRKNKYGDHRKSMEQLISILKNAKLEKGKGKSSQLMDLFTDFKSAVSGIKYQIEQSNVNCNFALPIFSLAETYAGLCYCWISRNEILTVETFNKAAELKRFITKTLERYFMDDAIIFSKKISADTMESLINDLLCIYRISLELGIIKMQLNSEEFEEWYADTFKRDNIRGIMVIDLFTDLFQSYMYKQVMEREIVEAIRLCASALDQGRIENTNEGLKVAQG